MPKKTIGKNSNFLVHNNNKSKQSKVISNNDNIKNDEEIDSSDTSESDENVENDSDEESDEDSNKNELDDEEDVSEESDSENEFEEQGSSSEDEDSNDDDDEDNDNSEDELATSVLHDHESTSREWLTGTERSDAIKKSKASGSLKQQQYLHTDDLSSDDEEDEEGNTIGRVPLHWYDAYDHIGYNIAGKKITKSKNQDRIDIALSNRDDPEARRTVYDMYNDRAVALSERDMEIIRRIQNNAFAHPEHNDTPDYIDHFSSIIEDMPLSAAPEPKSRFQPSKYELMKVMKIMKEMKEGRYIPLKDRANKERKNEEDDKKLYMLWDDQTDEVLAMAENSRMKFHLPAPKIPLPGHAESYNPPSEYLLDEDEEKEMLEQDRADRKYSFIPTKHACLRHVPGYDDFIKERFERCLDLYLCPRTLKRRLNIDPATLLPQLPKPKDLKPFPNNLCLQYIGHKAGTAILSLSLSPDGQYLASGGADGTVRIWEVDTCLCRHVFKIGKTIVNISDNASASGKKNKTLPITCVAFNPAQAHSLLAVAVGNRISLLTVGISDEDSHEVTETLLQTALSIAKNNDNINNHDGGDAEDDQSVDDDGRKTTGDNDNNNKNIHSNGTWIAEPLATSHDNGDKIHSWRGSPIGVRLHIDMKHAVSSISWHHKGDYLCCESAASDAGSRCVIVHQISKARSQAPFKKAPGKVQSVSFHPFRPFLFVATQQHVKVFHLVEQKLIKKLLTGCKWISSMDIHPSGDHILVGSYDRRIVWFDLDLSSTPYKTLKFHERAVRAVCYHKRYPLFASCSDDGSLHIFHGTVYKDLERNPMLVPLKVLKGHHGGNIEGDKNKSVLTLEWHNRQPWIFSGGSDGVINLYQDI